MEIQYCKYCGHKMQKNGHRNGYPRWRCPNKCKKKNISAQKQKAIDFVYNFISVLNAKSGNAIYNAKENLTQTAFKREHSVELKIEKIKEKSIPVNSYLVYKNNNELHLIDLRYADKGLSLNYIKGNGDGKIAHFQVKEGCIINNEKNNNEMPLKIVIDENVRLSQLSDRYASINYDYYHDYDNNNF